MNYDAAPATRTGAIKDILAPIASRLTKEGHDAMFHGGYSYPVGVVLIFAKFAGPTNEAVAFGARIAGEARDLGVDLEHEVVAPPSLPAGELGVVFKALVLHPRSLGGCDA